MIVELPGSNAANATISVGDGDITQRSVLDVISLTDTCYGQCAHKTVKTENLRALAFNGNSEVRSLEFRIYDTNGDPLTLPLNAEVFINLIVEY